MKKTSIRRKILTVVLGISMVSLVVFCLALLAGLGSVRSRMQTSSARLGDFAEMNSSRFLQRLAVDKLVTKAADQSLIINERLNSIVRDVVYFADIAEDLYKNAATLPPKPIPYSTSENYGTLTMQLRSANGKADYPRIRKEADLLGNLSQAYESNGSDMETMTIAVFTGTETGIFIIFDPFSDDNFQTFDPRERPWYIGAKKRGDTFWTSPYIGATSHRYMVTCSHPVRGPSGEFLGVTGIDVIIDDLDREIVNIGVSEGGYAFVVDSEGTLISLRGSGKPVNGAQDTRSAFIEGNENYNAVIRKMTRGESGFARVMTDDGDKYIAYSPIRATGWSVAIVQPVSEVLGLIEENSVAIKMMTKEAIDFVNTTIMVALVIFVLLFALVAYIVIHISGKLSDKITRPIVTLEDCLRRIAGGELDTRIELKTSDEIEQLGNSVNAMARELKEYINNLQIVTAEKGRLGAELDVARNIQESMLPYIFPPFPDRQEFDIYALMRPAKEVGGDFYDFFFINRNTLAVVMADVSGKGVPAALFMVIAKILIKSNAQAGIAPNEVFETVNAMLCENNETGMFVTAFMGYLNVDSGEFTFVNAGHTPPIIRSATTGQSGFLKVTPGFVIAGMEGMKYRQDKIVLQKGDELFMYTDGITEAESNGNGLFGSVRLRAAVDKYSGLPIKDLALSVDRDVGDFAAGAEQSDDITLLALRYYGAEATSDNSPTASELVVDAKTDNLEIVQNFVAKKLEAADCPTALRNKIAIAVEEIFVNIANYAYAPNVGSATVRVSAGKDVVIEFEDSGKEYDPLSMEDPDITLSAEDREIGGLGVFMAKKIMDTIEYRREAGKNILTMRKAKQT